VLVAGSVKLSFWELAKQKVKVELIPLCGGTGYWVHASLSHSFSGAKPARQVESLNR